MTDVLTIELAEGGLMQIGVPAAREVARALAAHEAQARPCRDLEDEIARYLSDHPGATTIQIEQGVRARGAAVREILAESDRFKRAPVPEGVAANAKCWSLASQGVVARPNASDEQP